VAKPRRSRRVLTVVILVLVSLSVITLDQTGRTHNLTSGVKSVANDVFSPIRSAVNDVLQPVGDFFAGAVHYGALQRQNQQLQASLGRLRQAQSQQAFAARQLQQLLALLHLPYLGQLPTVVAQTQEVNASNFAATIQIDKGRGQGVDVGDPVVGAGGLVGQVVEASHDTATVRLITDGQSKVGVAFGPGNQSTATVSGQGSGDPLSVDLIPPATQIHRGENLYTDQLQGAEFPAGIPVAYITSFHTVAGATQQTVAAQPLANLNELAYVVVVQWQPAP
jgi:rod shape-determining protein MreC